MGGLGPRGGSVVTDITPEEAQRKQRAGALMLDVREPYEWREGHIPDALHIPLGSLGRRAGELDRAREIVVVCHLGQRSAFAAQALYNAGFAQVSNLQGGMDAWERKRLPVTREEPGA